MRFPGQWSVLIRRANRAATSIVTSAGVLTIALSGCASVDNSAPVVDTTLAAINGARVNACPSERSRAGSQTGSGAASAGLERVNIALTPLASDATRQVRMRRITMASGAVIAWHTHEALQGMALIVSGEIVEVRSDCLDPIVHRPGDVAIEDEGTAHEYRNETDQSAVMLVAHVLPR